MKLIKALSMIALVAPLSLPAQAQIRLDPGVLGSIKLKPGFNLNPALFPMVRDALDKAEKERKKKEAAEKKLADKLAGSGWALPTRAEEMDLINDILATGNITAQNKELQGILRHGSFPTVFPVDYEKTAHESRPCRVSKAMLAYLRLIGKRGVRMQAGLMYDARVIQGGPHHEPYHIEVNNQTVLGCISTAADITHVNGRQVQFDQPDQVRDLLVDLIYNLPAGEYDIGFPREHYPNYKSDDYSSWDSDIKNYFVKKPWGSRFLTQDANGTSIFNEQISLGYNLFMPWYYNTTSPHLDHVKPQSGHPIHTDLSTYGDVGEPGRIERENQIRDAFKSGKLSEQVRVFMRYSNYGEDIAGAMESAERRGVVFKGFYGDALDHVHLKVWSIKDQESFGPADPTTMITQYGTNYAGGDARSFLITQRPDYTICQAACERDPACVAYTYVPPQVQNPEHAVCWIKNTFTQGTDERGLISGFRYKAPGTSMTVELNTNRPGYDIAGEPASHFSECAQKCQDRADCFSYTLVPAGVHGPSAMCYLKGEFAPGVTQPGMISGQKDNAEF